MIKFQQKTGHLPKNYKPLGIIRETIQSAWDKRKMSHRIQLLFTISKKPTSILRTERLQDMWEKREIGAIFAQAVRALKTFKKTKYQWSPALAKAGEEKGTGEQDIQTLLQGSIVLLNSNTL